MQSIVKSVGRIFDLLEFFEQTQAPQSLRDLALQFGWPISSTSSLLKSLVMRGYLDYDRFSRTYLPTMRMAMLGNWVSDVLLGGTSVLDTMQKLSSLTGETITLGAQSDLFAQHIHVIPSTYPVQVVLRPGEVRPLVHSGLGALLLSARDDETIDVLLRRSNREEEDRSRRLPLSSLMQRVNEVRHQGYVHETNVFAQGAAILGALVPETRLSRVLAITVIGPIERIEAKKDLILETIRTGLAQSGASTTIHAISDQAGVSP